jgi:hypothetical protein
MKIVLGVTGEEGKIKSIGRQARQMNTPVAEESHRRNNS